jgi:hypothetical protein
MPKRRDRSRRLGISPPGTPNKNQHTIKRKSLVIKTMPNASRFGLSVRRDKRRAHSRQAR